MSLGSHRHTDNLKHFNSLPICPSILNSLLRISPPLMHFNLNFFDFRFPFRKLPKNLIKIIKWVKTTPPLTMKSSSPNTLVMVKPSTVHFLNLISFVQGNCK